MQKFSGFSRIMALSRQYEAINILHKYPNLASTFNEPIPNLSNIKEISSFMRKVNTTINQFSASERVSDFNNILTAVSKDNFDSLATGIKVQGNTVILSTTARATLDSLNSELYKNKYHPKKKIKKTKRVQKVATIPIPSDSSKSLKANVSDSKRSFTISEFNKLYLPAIQYFFINVFIPVSLEIMTSSFSLSQGNNIQYEQKQLEISQQQLEISQQQLEISQQQLAVNKQRLETDLKILEELIKQSSLNHDTNITESLYSSISEDSDAVSSTESQCSEVLDIFPNTEPLTPEEFDILPNTEPLTPED